MQPDFGFVAHRVSGDMWAVAWNIEGTIVAASDDTVSWRELHMEQDASRYHLDADDEQLTWLNSQPLRRIEA